MTPFLPIEDLIDDQGDMAIIIEMDTSNPRQYYISAFLDLQTDSSTIQDLTYAYLLASDFSITKTDFTSSTYISHNPDNSYSF